MIILYLMIYSPSKKVCSIQKYRGRIFQKEYPRGDPQGTGQKMGCRYCCLAVRSGLGIRLSGISGWWIDHLIYYKFSFAPTVPRALSVVVTYLKRNVPFWNTLLNLNRGMAIVIRGVPCLFCEGKSYR